MILNILFLWFKLIGLLILLNMGFGIIVTILYTLLFKKIIFKSTIYNLISIVFCICFLSINIYCYGYFLSKSLEIFNSLELKRLNLVALYLPLFVALFIIYQISKFSISKTEEQANINFILSIGMRCSVGLINLLHLILIIKPTLIGYLTDFYKSI